jgi:hypothetical protein
MIDLCAECCYAICDARIPTFITGDNGEKVYVFDIPFSLATQLMRGTVKVYRNDLSRVMEMVAVTTVNSTRYCATDAARKLEDALYGKKP